MRDRDLDWNALFGSRIRILPIGIEAWDARVEWIGCCRGRAWIFFRSPMIPNGIKSIGSLADCSRAFSGFANCIERLEKYHFVLQPT